MYLVGYLVPFQTPQYPKITHSPNHKVSGKLAEQAVLVVSAFADFDASIKVVPGKVFVDMDASVYQEMNVDFGQSACRLFLRANTEDIKTATRTIYACQAAESQLHPVVTAPHTAQLLDQILHKIVAWHATELLTKELSKTYPKAAYTNKAVLGCKPTIDLDQTGTSYTLELEQVGDRYSLGCLDLSMGLDTKPPLLIPASELPRATSRIAEDITQDHRKFLAWEEYDQQVTTILMQYLTLHGIEAEMATEGNALNISIGTLNTMAYCHQEEPGIFQLVIMMDKNKCHPRFGTTSQGLAQLGKLVSVMEGLTVPKAKAYVRDHQAKQLAETTPPAMTTTMDLV